MSPDETQTIERLSARALASYDQRPDAESVAALVDDLITAGNELHTKVSAIPTGRRSELAGAALLEWTFTVDSGPSGRDAHANWNHARGLARLVRTLTSALAS